MEIMQMNNWSSVLGIIFFLQIVQLYLDMNGDRLSILELPWKQLRLLLAALVIRAKYPVIREKIIMFIEIYTPDMYQPTKISKKTLIKQYLFYQA